jgi:long-chain fatty acid transport protein
VATVSIKYGFTDNFRVLADFQRTGWSSLQDVTIKRTSGTVVGSEPFQWGNSNFMSLGAEYDISPAFTLRGGIGSDKTPTNDQHRTPRLPDNDRTLYSIGASWNVSDNLSLDAGYQHITIKSPTVNLPVDVGTGNTSTLAGKFSGYANLVGVSMQYRF